MKNATRLYIGFLCLLLALSQAHAGGPAPDRPKSATARDRAAFRDAMVYLRALSARGTPRPAENDSATADGSETDGKKAGPASSTGEAGTRGFSPQRTLPLHLGAFRAPRLRRPSPNPLDQFAQQTLRDAIMRPVEFGEPGLGFTPPDLAEPLRDIEADTMVTDMNTGETVLRDNVRLRLGTMYFRADTFRYSEEAGNYAAEGNVLVEQEASTLTAHRLSYTTPEPDIGARAFVLEPAPMEGDRSRQRLRMGRLLAENLHVVEPTRELFAAHADYDFASQQGELRQARGLAAVFFYDADKIRILGPDDAVIENAWLTTCPQETPHYRIRFRELTIQDGMVTSAQGARLMLGSRDTPFHIPLWRRGDERWWLLDFDSGRRAEIGYFVNVGQQFDLSPQISAGPRIMPTQKQGIGFGGDVYYNFMNQPASRLYRTRGQAHVLYTTEDRGYGLWKHRYEFDNDLVLRMQVEQWSDEEFFKDFFYDEYLHRTTPRTFANLTYQQPDFIATGTVHLNTHSWISETERLPEATFHLLDRPLFDRLYISYDNVTGYNHQAWRDQHGVRTVNIARLTYDWDPAPGLAVTPFYELEGTWYQNRADGDSSADRFSQLAGVTLQSRLHKVYPGFWGFSGFKHVVVPSITYSYRPTSTLHPDETPRFDALDNVYGRSRIETSLNNVFYGRDAETGEVWQAGRITLYQGHDFWNEQVRANDYEAEIDIRPRPWWGLQLLGERHAVDQHSNRAGSRRFWPWFSRDHDGVNGRVRREEAAEFNERYADYSRILTLLNYHGTTIGRRFGGRLGFSYTDEHDETSNREVLYGFGYRLSDQWTVGFEHVYSLDDRDLRTQTYELRRRFDCWESAVRFLDRESGFDINLEISLLAYTGEAIRF